MEYNNETNWWQILEVIRNNIQNIIDNKQSKLERNIKGQHPTPFKLASKILSLFFEFYNTKSLDEIRFLEPAIGLGVFYSAFLSLTEGRIPSFSLGVEKYEELAGLSSAIWEKAGLHIVRNDFTTLTPPDNEDEKFHLIITNPPYIRHHHIEKDDKIRLSDLVSNKLGIKTSGLMGLYGFFLLLSHNWMQKNGIGVWLIPREFFDVKYGAVLKKYLTEYVELLRVHCFDIDDVQFESAEVTSTIIILKNSIPSKEHEVHFSFGSLDNPRKEIFVSNNSLKKIEKWSAIDKKDVIDLIITEKERNHFLKIGDIFNVKRGFATGNNTFFIMTLKEAKNKKIPKKFLTPTLPSSRYLKENIIRSNEKGIPLTEPTLFYLNCDLPKKVIEIKYPKLYDYILKGEKENISAGYLARARSPWYKQEIRHSAPILCAYAGRNSKKGKSIRFYRNKSKAVATNAYYNLYPKQNVIKDIDDLESFFDKIFDVLQKLEQDEILLKGRSYGGGFNKIEPKELENVILPKIFGITKRKLIQNKLNK